MKIISVLLILLFVINSHSVAQIQQFQIGYGGHPLILENEKTNIRIHKYLSNDWKSGSIVSENDLQSNIEFRYDILNDRIEFRSILNPNFANIVVIAGKFFIYTNFISDDYLRNGYFEMIYGGKTKLLVRRTANLVQGKKGAYGFEAYTTVIKSYYLKISNKPATPFDKKNDGIVNLLSSKESLTKYIKKEKLNTKKDKDIVKLLKYYDSL